MRVMLINTPAEKVTQRWDRPDFPPLGLGHVAGSLLAGGHEVEVLDAKLEGLPLNALLARVPHLRADVYGLTAMTHEIVRAARVAKALKDAHPESLVLIGGCHATALPGETLGEFPAFDVAFCGEAEESVLEVLACIERGESLNSVLGIAFRDGTRVQVTAPRPWIRDLDAIPLPAWSLFPRTPTYPVMTTRGCPFRCVFCMRVLGSQVRYRSPESVVGELEHLAAEYHPKDVVFYDETFTLNRRRVTAILELMIERGLHRKFTWVAQTRVNECDEELLALMARAGCREIDFGIESGNTEVLAKIGKGITLDDARRAVRAAQKVGIEVVTLFILGHPGETRETAKDTINFATALNGDRLALGIMVPYPGTEVARMAGAGECGYKLLSHDWSDFDKYLGNALELDTLTRRDLERLQLWGYLKFYLWNRRFGDLSRMVFSRWREGVAAVNHLAGEWKMHFEAKRTARR
jgi:anaerobic magnesium-protoporphyrin IX monomethyl ester cyclase